MGGAKTQEVEETVRRDQREEEIQTTIYHFAAVLLNNRERFREKENEPLKRLRILNTPQNIFILLYFNIPYIYALITRYVVIHIYFLQAFSSHLGTYVLPLINFFLALILGSFCALFNVSKSSFAFPRIFSCQYPFEHFK